MPDYSKCCVYKLCCKDATVESIYIGSTTNIIKRKHDHKKCCTNPDDKEYDTYKYQFIRDNGGWDNWCLIAIEEFSCSSKLEQLKMERNYIENLKPSLNKTIPARHQTGDVYNKKEYSKGYYNVNKDSINEKKKEYIANNKEKIKKQHKEHYEANKDKIRERQKHYFEANISKIKERRKEYYEANKDIINEKKKKYYEANKDKISEQHKQYTEANKDKINEHRYKPFVCECGRTIRYGDKARHCRTKVHQDYISSSSSPSSSNEEA